MRSSSRVLMALAVAAISGSVSCTTATTVTRQTRPDPPDERLVRSVEAAAVAHQPWRPLHKGGSYLSTGVYIRDDDDLIVNTPFPIVLPMRESGGYLGTAIRAFPGLTSFCPPADAFISSGSRRAARRTAPFSATTARRPNSTARS